MSITDLEALAQSIYHYIRKYIAENEYAPSYREIAQHFGVAKSSVQRRIDILVGAGLLDRVDNQPRSLSIPEHRD